MTVTPAKNLNLKQLLRIRKDNYTSKTKDYDKEAIDLAIALKSPKQAPKQDLKLEAINALTEQVQYLMGQVAALELELNNIRQVNNNINISKSKFSFEIRSR